MFMFKRNARQSKRQEGVVASQTNSRFMSREQLCTKLQEQASQIRIMRANLDKNEKTIRELLQIEVIARNSQHIIGMFLARSFRQIETF